MLVTQHHNQEDLPLSSTKVESLIKMILEKESIETDEIIVHFISKDEITKLHEKFFGDPTPTDCITQPIDPPGSKEPYKILGEIFICPKVAIEYNKDDPYQEVSLYIVHAVLHLLGFKDKTEKEIQKMRQKESKVMNYLQTKNLVLSH